MLENIKSKYICRKPFCLLLINKKLKIIKYNKALQNKINITLNDYKEYSGRYLIYESWTKGKEYDKDGNLIFIGNYLNGEKIGEGREYYHGTKIFEGEYLKDKKTGKGKEFSGDGYYFSECEYLNNYKIKGEEYEDGELAFKGKYLNGIRWEGFLSKIIKNDVKEKIRYEGEFKDGKINGKGKEYIEYYEKDYDLDDSFGPFYKLINKELYFEGEYKEGKRWNGEGKELDEYFEFEGEYKEGEIWNCKGKEFDFF